MQFAREIIVDNFAGGGGFSTGAEMATGRPVEIAVNHDPAAIAMHRVNHPHTKHYCENVWEIDPREAAAGRPIGLAWFSPDCKHFSRAKGGKPVEKNIRGLAWVAVRWAATVRPRVIMLENVEEFKTWGPLLKDGYPDPKQKGRTFNCFVNALKRQGYQVETRELRACNYGAPTIRKRFFLIARCDGLPIVWPKPTHGDPNSPEVKAGNLKPWRTAAEIIDWSKPCPSIFDRKKPLAENTMQRITKGISKFFINNPEPFIINYKFENEPEPIGRPLSTITSINGHYVVAPFLTQYHQETACNETRGQALDRPLLTVDSSPRYGLVSVFISKYYGTGEGSKLTEPLHTVTTKDRNALIVSHLVKMKGTNIGQKMMEPVQTITAGGLHFGEVRTVLTKVSDNQDLGHWPQVREMLNKYCGYSIASDEILLLGIDGGLYYISDIGMRMLEPRELFNAQGFPPDYIIDRDVEGKSYPKAAQVARCGNAVPPPFAEHLVRANLPELCGIEEPIPYKQMSLF